MCGECYQRESGRRGRKVKARVRKALIGGSIPLAAYYNRTDPVGVLFPPSLHYTLPLQPQMVTGGHLYTSPRSRPKVSSSM